MGGYRSRMPFSFPDGDHTRGENRYPDKELSGCVRKEGNRADNHRNRPVRA